MNTLIVKIFSEQIIDLMNNDNILVMSDEAHFHLDGYANKQNARCWSDTKLKSYKNASCIVPKSYY